jgi:CRISPR type III-B/RAMP module-associated protein Cmr5
MSKEGFKPEKDPIKVSIDLFDSIYRSIFKKLKEIPEIKEVTNMEASLRARSREMPSLIQEIGLIGALSYCFSKGNEFYNGIMELIKGEGSKEQTEEYIKKIKDYAEKTDAGYSIYLYFLLNAINYTGILNVDVNKPYDAIKELSMNLNKTRIIERMIMPYLLQIKRLCEGMLRGK